MRDETARALVELNRRFYAEYADAFDARRQRPWAGWSPLIAAALERVGKRRAAIRLLDLGCGNGRFALRFAEAAEGYEVEIVGLDASPGLLAAARRRTGAVGGSFRWVAADLTRRGPLSGGADFDLVALFGVLHHVPGFRGRARLLRQAAERLEPGGSLLVSLWRFRDEPRIVARAIPRSRAARLVGLAEGELDLEPGDAFLRWGPSGGDWPCRYCHHVGAEEADRLWREAGVRPYWEGVADGPSGRSNHYLALRRAD